MDLRVLLTIFVLGACVHTGISIVCYQCNSAYDPRCGDPFDSYSLGEVNCSMKPKLLHLSNLTATVCRKNVQKVYGKIRVVRGCGYLTDDAYKDGRSCIQRSGTHDVNVIYCTCEHDLCNGARPLRVAPPLLLLPIALLALLAVPSVL